MRSKEPIPPDEEALLSAVIEPRHAMYCAIKLSPKPVAKVPPLSAPVVLFSSKFPFRSNELRPASQPAAALRIDSPAAPH
jgi:hypothetical protein